MSSNKRRVLRANLLVDTSSEEEEEEWQNISTPPPQKRVALEERGLPADVKQKLIAAVDNKGGLEVVSNSSRTLQAICNSDPDTFGSPTKCRTPRGRRKQVSNFIDKFKRLDPQQRAARRTQLFAATPPPAAATLTPSSASVTPSASPPPLTKKPRGSMSSSSPYRSKKSSKNADDGRTINCWRRFYYCYCIS